MNNAEPPTIDLWYDQPTGSATGANADAPKVMRTKIRYPISADQEAWILVRLDELLQLHKSILLNRICWPGASETMVDGAIEDAKHGVAQEIIYTLGLNPCFVNIKQSSKK